MFCFLYQPFFADNDDDNEHYLSFKAPGKYRHVVVVYGSVPQDAPLIAPFRNLFRLYVNVSKEYAELVYCFLSQIFDRGCLPTICLSHKDRRITFSAFPKNIPSKLFRFSFTLSHCDKVKRKTCKLRFMVIDVTRQESEIHVYRLYNRLSKHNTIAPDFYIVRFNFLPIKTWALRSPKI